MGKQPPEPGDFNLWGQLAYTVTLVGGMALVIAIANTLIYGSPLGPWSPEQQQPAEASQLPPPAE